MQKVYAGLASGMENSNELFELTPQIAGSSWGPESYQRLLHSFENNVNVLK